jgi:glucosamine-6-phosphate deaminase
MRLIIRDDYEEVSKFVATYVKDKINAFKPTPDKPFVLGIVPYGVTYIYKVFQQVQLLLVLTRDWLNSINKVR